MKNKLKNITSTLLKLGIAAGIVVGIVMITSEPAPRETGDRGQTPLGFSGPAPIFLHNPLSDHTLRTGKTTSADRIHRINTNARWKGMSPTERYIWMVKVYEQELRDMKAAKEKGEYYISRARRNLGYLTGIGYYLPYFYDIDLHDVDYQGVPLEPLPKQSPKGTRRNLMEMRIIPDPRLHLSLEEYAKIGEGMAAQMSQRIEARRAAKRQDN